VALRPRLSPGWPLSIVAAARVPLAQRGVKPRASSADNSQRPVAVDRTLTRFATTGVVTTGASPGTATITASSPPASGTRVVNVVAAGVSYGTSIQPVWNTSCAGAGCHVGASPPAQSLDLEAATSHGNLVDAASAQVPLFKRVRAFRPDSSYLVHKLQGTQSHGFRMPLGAAALPDATINLVRDWVLQGAPNN